MIRRALKLVLLLLLVGTIVGGIAWAGVMLAERRATILSDGATINVPLRDEAPREFMWTPPARLPGIINSTFDDYEPQILDGGRTLLFVRGRAGQNADILASHWTPSGWSEPQPLDGVNSDADDLGPEISRDQSTIYFYSNRSGGLGGYDLWVAQRRPDGDWSEPRNLGPGVNTVYHDYGPALTPDGATLYFASNRPKAQEAPDDSEQSWSATVREDLFRRDYDLYIAEANDQQFTSARPLTALNTDSNEGTPSVSPAGDFLLFASDRRGGQGGFDLYKSRRLDGAHWPVESLGPTINTPANELDPAPSMGGFALHFSSDRPPETLEPVATSYDLFVSESREVFRRIDRRQLEVEWAQLWSLIGPWLLWLALLALLLLLALLALRDGRVRGRWSKLGLLARCILLSLLLHALLLAMLAAWQVSDALGELFRKPGGTKVALISRVSGDGIASQIRGQMAAFELEFAPSSESLRREAEPLSLAQVEAARMDLEQVEELPATRMEVLSMAQESSAPDAPPPEPTPLASAIEPASHSDVELPQSDAAAARFEPHLVLDDARQIESQQPQTTLDLPSAEPARASIEPNEIRAAPTPTIQSPPTPTEAQPDATDPSSLALEPPRNAPAPPNSSSTVATPQHSAAAAQVEPDVGSVETAIRGPARHQTHQPSRADATPAGARVEPDDSNAPSRSAPLALQIAAQDAASGMVRADTAGGAEMRTDVPPTVALGTVSVPVGERQGVRDEGSLRMPDVADPSGPRIARAAPEHDAPASQAHVEPSSRSGLTKHAEDSLASSAASDARSASPESADSAAPASIPVEVPAMAAGVMALPESDEIAADEPDISLPPARTSLQAARPVEAAPSSGVQTSSLAQIEPGSGGDGAQERDSTLAGAAAPQSSAAADASDMAATSSMNVDIGPAHVATISTPSTTSTSEREESSVDLPAASVMTGRLAQSSDAESLIEAPAVERAALDPSADPGAVASSTLTAPPSEFVGEAQRQDQPPSGAGSLSIDLAAVAVGDVSLPSSQTNVWSDEHQRREVGTSGSLDESRAALDPSAAAPQMTLAPTVISPGSTSSTTSTGRPLVDLSAVSTSAPPRRAEEEAQLPIPGAPALALAFPLREMPEEDVGMYPQRAPEVREQLVEKGGGSEETEQAVEAALAWLAARQEPEGHWTGQNIPVEAGGDISRYRFDTALTGLSLLCFLGAGHTPQEEGPYQDVVERAIEWLTRHVQESGDMRTGLESLYSQGIGAIALAEAYGMTRDPRLAELVERAIGFIADSRSTKGYGGWRYVPGEEGDTSVLGWQVMALISAKRAGIDVPAEALRGAGDWLQFVSRPERPGLYAYKPGRRPTPSMTAEAMYVRQILGDPRDAQGMAESVDYILDYLPDWDDEPNTYFWYYATLAMFQHSGPAWERWNKEMADELLEHQRTDDGAAGSWDPTDRWALLGGRVYQTAICALMLEVYYRYLPLYVIERPDAQER